ncbi:MAG: type I-C CRISPR-associated protein Cas5c [Oscillospiraceae bacterium]|nr:type I-C CRISPR-associated protein Cas5c [Oscillospiraceae bacterium]
MGYGIKALIEGEAACFTRPEMKGERVSYDVITPSAARGVLEAIYWHPGIRWVIDRIEVLNEIQFDSIRRNELGSKIPFQNVTTAMKRGSSELHQIITEDRQQRATLYLKNVAYVLDAHFLVDPNKSGALDTPAKHYNIFLRRARDGQNHHAPCLGCREFTAKVRLIEPGDEVPRGFYENEASRDLGWMLWDMVYGDGPKDVQAKFFRAVMRHGVIDVSEEEAI